MGFSVKDYREIEKLPPDIKSVLLAIFDEKDNSVKKDDFNELKAVVAEVAEAQKKTEVRVSELAEAQKKTEESLNKLIKRVDNIEEQFGGLAMSVVYSIEDKLYPFIDKFVSRVFGVEFQETVLRYHIVYGKGKYDEFNLYTKCKKDEKEFLAIGECKAQIGKKDVDKSVKTVSRVKDYTGKEVFKYIIGYTFFPEVEGYIKTNYPELKYFKTYQVEH